MPANELYRFGSLQRFIPISTTGCAAMAKVMIVEDETLIRFTLADALIDAGHVVIECGNVLEAVAALARHDDIEAVVTDIDMPGGLSGLELVGLMKATRSSVPVWVTSGRKVDIAHLKGAAFFPKPYDFAGLAQVITCHVVIAEQRRSRQMYRSGVSRPSR
jgi:DNA-binding NtrC family response regulator